MDPKVVARMARPTPDQARLISPADFRKMENCKDAMRIVNDQMIFARDTYWQSVENVVGTGQTLNFIRKLEHQFTRILLSKSRLPDFDAGISSGKMDAEKAKQITQRWLEFMIEKFPLLRAEFEKTGAVFESDSEDDGNVHDEASPKLTLRSQKKT